MSRATRAASQGQLALSFPATWGGARRNAGRKPSPRPNVPHRSRPAQRAAHPVRVTLRSRLAPLRSQFLFPSVRLALTRAARRDPNRFRIVHYSVAGRSRPHHRRGHRQARTLERHPQHRDSNRALRERSATPARPALGGSLPQPRPLVSARGAKRARLRPRELSQARTARLATRNRSVFVRRDVRRLARMAAATRHATAVRGTRDQLCGRRACGRSSSGEQRIRRAHVASAYRLAKAFAPQRPRKTGNVSVTTELDFAATFVHNPGRSEAGH